MLTKEKFYNIVKEAQRQFKAGVDADTVRQNLATELESAGVELLNVITLSNDLMAKVKKMDLI